jgi:hypothetical protein
MKLRACEPAVVRRRRQLGQVQSTSVLECRPGDDRVILTGERVQGLAVCGDTLAVSTSCGPHPRQLAFYAWPLAVLPMRVALPRGTTTGVDLNAAVPLAMLVLSAGAQDLNSNGERLLVNFEGGARRYRERRRSSRACRRSVPDCPCSFGGATWPQPSVTKRLSTPTPPGSRRREGARPRLKVCWGWREIAVSLQDSPPAQNEITLYDNTFYSLHPFQRGLDLPSPSPIGGERSHTVSNTPRRAAPPASAQPARRERASTGVARVATIPLAMGSMTTTAPPPAHRALGAAEAAARGAGARVGPRDHQVADEGLADRRTPPRSPTAARSCGSPRSRRAPRRVRLARRRRPSGRTDLAAHILGTAPEALAPQRSPHLPGAVTHAGRRRPCTPLPVPRERGHARQEARRGAARTTAVVMPMPGVSATRRNAQAANPAPSPRLALPRPSGLDDHPNAMHSPCVRPAHHPIDGVVILSGETDSSCAKWCQRQYAPSEALNRALGGRP